MTLQRPLYLTEENLHRTYCSGSTFSENLAEIIFADQLFLKLANLQSYIFYKFNAETCKITEIICLLSGIDLCVEEWYIYYVLLSFSSEQKELVYIINILLSQEYISQISVYICNL